jgi:hypothetical protein
MEVGSAMRITAVDVGEVGEEMECEVSEGTK